MNRRTLTTKRRSLEKPPAGEVTQAPASVSSPGSTRVDGDARRQLIASEAYFLAQRRGFTPGCELDDWLAAEAIVEDRLRSTRGDVSSPGSRACD